MKTELQKQAEQEIDDYVRKFRVDFDNYRRETYEKYKEEKLGTPLVLAICTKLTEILLAMQMGALRTEDDMQQVMRRIVKNSIALVNQAKNDMNQPQH